MSKVRQWLEEGGRASLRDVEFDTMGISEDMLLAVFMWIELDLTKAASFWRVVDFAKIWRR